MTAAQPLANSVHVDGSTQLRPLESLRSYTKAKLAIASQLRALLEVLRKRGGESRVRRCEELMVKLAEDRFTLAVLGQFKRGKSSLMNAIIGRDLLPTGVLPLTSAITALRFGPTERLIIQRQRIQFPEILPVSELAAFVTEKGNPGNAKRVTTATVEVPVPFLRRGLEFVDTPGVGSSIEANTQTTYGFIPECDAALFVTSVDTPLTETELKFLRTIRQHVKKLFFVINKVDLLQSEAEHKEIVAFVTQAICREMNVPSVKVFSVSSRDGLNAFRRHDHDGYRRSGLGVLQQELSDFLSGENARVLLASIIDRGITLLEEETGELGLYEQARLLSATDRNHILSQLEDRFQHHRQLRAAIYLEMRRSITNKLHQFAASEIPSLLTEQYKTHSRALNRLPKRAERLPYGWLGRRLAIGMFRRAQFRVRHWMETRIVEPGVRGDRELNEHWRKIQSDLRNLPVCSSMLLDLPAPKPVSDETRPLELEMRPERPFVFKDNWDVSTCEWLDWIPVRAVKGIFRRRWNESESAFVAKMSAQVSVFLVDLADYALARFRQDTEKVATEIESRLLAAIKGERPPRPAAQQTCTPLEAIGWGGQALHSIRTNLATIRESLGHFQDTEVPALDQVPIPTEIVRRRALRAIEDNISNDLKTRGCPVCNQLVDAAYNFFIECQYVLGTDEKAQTEFSDELGFCPLHTWQLTAVSSPLGGSVGFAPFTQHLSRAIESAAGSESAATTIRQLFCSTEKCRVCALLRKTESNYLERLGAFLSQPSNRTLYVESQGVCLRHLGLLLTVIRDSATRELVLKSAARHFEEIAEDMQSYAIKREATRRSLLNNDENDAWSRAITHISGAQPVCCPWPQDGEI